ncbi:MAG: VOC family protein [Acidimicrobiia bacterium]
MTLEAGLVGRDPARLDAFYTRVMGFKRIDRLDFAVGSVHKFRRGAARLKIFFPSDRVDPVAGVEPWFRPGGWRYAALHVDRPDDVDALVAAVEAADGRVVMPPANHRAGARMAMVCDPEGNVWELLAEPAGEDGS